MAYRKNVKRIDPRYFLHETVDRDLRLILEVEGPEQSLSQWAQRFPRAAEALENAGASLQDILRAIAAASVAPDQDLPADYEAPRPDPFDLGVFEGEGQKE